MRTQNGPKRDMLERYRRAEVLEQGIWTRKVAFNTTIIPHWIGETNCFWYFRETRRGGEFRIVNAKTGDSNVAFDHRCLAELLSQRTGREVSPENLEVTKLKFDLEGRVLEFDCAGARWRFDQRTPMVESVQRENPNETMSPDGRWSALVRDHNLWLRNVETGDERALTTDGRREYAYATAPTAYGHRTGNSTEALWSADSTRLFVVLNDIRDVKRLAVSNFTPSESVGRPKIEYIPIAFPGDSAIDVQHFLAFEVETGKRIDAAYCACPVFRNARGYFSARNGFWGRDNRHTYFVHLDRHDRHVRLVEFDTHTGATRIVLEEESPDVCFKLHPDCHGPAMMRRLDNSDDLLWYSERTGWGHLYLYDLETGKLKQPVTSGDWMVREVLHYDAARREVIIQTCGRTPGRNPYKKDICRVHVDTGKVFDIASSDDEYVVFDPTSELGGSLGTTRDIGSGSGIAPSGDFIVTTRSDIDEMPVTSLYDREGNKLLDLETADISGMPDGWLWPEAFSCTSEDGETDIWGVIYRPSHFDEGNKYPVIDFSWNHHEGCHYQAGSFTNNSLAGYYFFRSLAFAELGFIVVFIAGRGTCGRNRRFACAPDSYLPDSANQRDRVHFLKKLAEEYSYIDIDRIGVGEGMSTSAALSGLLGRPDIYKVGVSNNAVFDLRATSAFWGEAYGGPDILNKGRKQIVDYARNLKGRLLIMSGALDKAAPTALRLIEELRKNNKDFDMLFLPNDGHVMSSYAQRRGWDYFVTHLLEETPPVEFELTNSVDEILQAYNEERHRGVSVAAAEKEAR